MVRPSPKSETRTLDIAQPLDLAPSLESGQAHRWSRSESEDPEGSDGWLWGVVEGNLIKIRAADNGTRDGSICLEFQSVPESDADNFGSLLWRYFRLDDDLETIYEDIARDPRVDIMVRRYRGLRLLRTEPWECLIAFICSANSNIARIRANMESMSEAFGSPLTLDGHTRHTFPAPLRLAGAGEAALRKLGLGFRAPYVARAAEAVASGELDMESLRHMPYHEAQATLMELPGIGPKIADCVLLHSLDKLEAFPIDVWVRRALREWYFPGQKAPPDRVMNEWAQGHFGANAGYAELYLFHGRRLNKHQVEP